MVPTSETSGEEIHRHDRIYRSLFLSRLLGCVARTESAMVVWPSVRRSDAASCQLSDGPMKRRCTEQRARGERPTLAFFTKSCDLKPATRRSSASSYASFTNSTVVRPSTSSAIGCTFPSDHGHHLELVISSTPAAAAAATETIKTKFFNYFLARHKTKNISKFFQFVVKFSSSK